MENLVNWAVRDTEDAKPITYANTKRQVHVGLLLPDFSLAFNMVQLHLLMGICGFHFPHWLVLWMLEVLTD